MKPQRPTRRVLCGGYIPSLRAQREFRRGFDRYVEVLRNNAPFDEGECELCERPTILPDRLCDECASDAR